MFYWCLALMGFFAFQSPYSFATLQAEEHQRLSQISLLPPIVSNLGPNIRPVVAPKRNPYCKEEHQQEGTPPKKRMGFSADIFPNASGTSTHLAYVLHTYTYKLTKENLKKLNQLFKPQKPDSGYKIGKRFFRIEEGKLCSAEKKSPHQAPKTNSFSQASGKVSPQPQKIYMTTFPERHGFSETPRYFYFFWVKPRLL